MHFLQNFSSKILQYDLINKFIYNNTHKISKIQKVILSFGAETNNIKQVLSSLFILELIGNQKSVLTKAKKANVLLKIRKGNPVGCKVILRKFNLHNFFSKIIFKILPEIKSIKKLKKNTFCYKLYDLFTFAELEDYYFFLSNISKLNICIVTNATNKNELFFILKSLRF